MRSGTTAALLLTAYLAWPAFAEPDTSAPAPVNVLPAQSAAAAAAAAAKAAKTAPAATAPPQTETPQQAAAPAEPASNAVAPPAAAVDEAPADPATSTDTPPQTATIPAPVPATPPTTTAKAPAEDTKTDPATVASEPAKPKLVAAKTLFGAAKDAAPLAARAIGTYARGCLAGAKPLAVDGPNWQAMRLSRNRTWGHPDLIALLERFASEVKDDGWPGLLVGDLSQPRGGPMLTGHASHQLGLDADIWFTPMPDHRLSRKERENLSATSMLAGDSLSVDPKVWTDSRTKIIKRVASYPKVERVLVHPAIKKALCDAGGTDRAWLNKVRPYWGHFYHFHVRIGCPAGSQGCKPQAPVPGDDGCGKELDDWFKLLTRKPKPKPPGEPKIVVKPAKPKPPMTLDDLPQECRMVLATGRDIELPPPAVAATSGAPKAKPAAKASVTGSPASGSAKAPAKPKPAAQKATDPKPSATKAAAAKTPAKSDDQ
jgi:penicillin-insensitive murein endopeptidase